MKKFLLFILFIASYLGTSEGQTIVAGSGNILTAGSPNSIASIDLQDPRYEGVLATDTNNWKTYKYVGTNSSGSRWVEMAAVSGLGSYLPLAGGTLTGNLLFSLDNTLDIGASGATRPRTGYFGTSIITPAATISSMTLGSVLFAGTGGAVTQDNANLFWDDTNNRLGIGTTGPNTKLEINGALSSDYFAALRLAGTGTGTTYRRAGIEYYDGVSGTMLASASGMRGEVSGHWGGAYSIRVQQNNLPQTAESSLTNMLTFDGFNNRSSFPTGNVGIGTTVPPRNLSVVSNTPLTTTTSNVISFSHATSGIPGIAFGAAIEGRLEKADGTEAIATTYETKWSDATNGTADLYFGLLNAGTPTNVLTILGATGAVGIGTTAPTGLLQIGNGSGTNSVDPAVNVNRVLDTASGSGNAHGYTDSSVLSRGGGMGYNSFDGRFVVNGTGNYDHIVPFQGALMYSSSGTIGNIYGLYNNPTITDGIVTNTYGILSGLTITGGAVTNNYGLFLNNPSKSVGTLINNYGVYVDAQTSGTNNYAAILMGKVGIDVAAPSEKLHINAGNILIDGTGSKTLTLTRSSGASLQLGASILLTGGYIKTTTDSPFYLGANNVDWVTILSSGNVGIGTRIPDVKLDVNLGTASALQLTYNDEDGSAATYTKATLSSTGLQLFDAVGTAPGFSFNDRLISGAGNTDVIFTPSDSVKLFSALNGGITMTGGFIREYDSLTIRQQLNLSNGAQAINLVDNTASAFVWNGDDAKPYLNANTTNGSELLALGSTDVSTKIVGALQDKDGDVGTSGQVLTSTVTGTNWRNLSSGIYTPTVAMIAGTDTILNVYSFKYSVVDSIVTGSGRVKIGFETGTNVTSFTITLPVLSAFTDDNVDASGTVDVTQSDALETALARKHAKLNADAASDKIIVGLEPIGTTVLEFKKRNFVDVIFQYKIK